MIKILPLHRVESSALSHVGHDGVSTLHVKFHDGSVYEYPGVTPQAYTKLLAAKSVGAHFMSNIRDNYKGKRLV